MKRILLALLLLTSFPGCMYYYKVQTVKPVAANEIKKYDSLNKYLILHQGDSSWHLSNLVITDKILSGNFSPLPWEHLKYKTTKPTGGNRYKKMRKPTEIAVLDEVHLYIQDSLVSKFDSGDYIQIAFSAIKKAEVYKKAKGKTTASWLIPAIAVPLSIPIFIIIIYGLSGAGPVRLGL